MDLAIIIKYASNFSHLLPIYFGRKEKTLLWWYAIAGLLFDLVSLVMRFIDMPVPGQGNLFIVIEFIIISQYYQKYALHRLNVFNYYILLVVLVFLVHTLFVREYDVAIRFDRLRLNLQGGAILYLHYIIYAMVGLYKMMQKPDNDFIERSQFFWANVAFLIYSSGVFFIFLFKDIISDADRVTIVMLWSYVFCGLNIIKNMLLAKSLSLQDASVRY